jgi:hypothetical protein
VASSGIVSAEAEIALFDLARLAEWACYGAGVPRAAGVRQALSDAATVVKSARGNLARWQVLMTSLDPRNLLT